MARSSRARTRFSGGTSSSLSFMVGPAAEAYKQVRPGRPGPDTAYRRSEHRHYRAVFVGDTQALQREGLCAGLSPLLTNDESLSAQGALRRYKYQPFAEKRHE